MGTPHGPLYAKLIRNTIRDIHVAHEDRLLVAVGSACCQQMVIVGEFPVE